MMALLLVGTVPNTALAATKLEKIETQSLLKKEEMVKLDSEISQTLVKVNGTSKRSFASNSNI